MGKAEKTGIVDKIHGQYPHEPHRFAGMLPAETNLFDKEFSHFQYIFMHQSIRILLFNPAHELLFMGAEDKNLTGVDGNKGRFWFLVGGTLEAGETFQAAAKRELTEETGLTDADVVWGAEIAEGTVHLKKNNQPLNIYQRFIVAKTEKDTVRLNNLDAWEQNAVKGLRWFSPEEIQTSKETLYPRMLKAYLPQIISDLPKFLEGNAPEKLAVWDLD